MLLPKGDLNYSIDNEKLRMDGYWFNEKRNAFSCFFENKLDGKLYYADLTTSRFPVPLDNEIMIFPVYENDGTIKINWGIDVYCANPKKVDIDTFIDHIQKFIEIGVHIPSLEEKRQRTIRDAPTLDAYKNKHRLLN